MNAAAVKSRHARLAERKRKLKSRELLAYSVSEAAELLCISESRLYRLITANVIPHKRLGRRIIIPAGLFREWLNTPEGWTSSDL